MAHWLVQSNPAKWRVRESVSFATRRVLQP
jgi:hypothetical protein